MTRTADDDTRPVLAGAEAWSSPGGGAHGALVLHGFTGNPNSMRGVAEALAGAGFAVELPRLPGHGTDLDDMLDTTFGDWSAAAEDEPAGPMGELVDEAIAAGTEVFPGIGSDIADPDSAETSYSGTPLRALRTLLTAVDELQPALGRITCPVLILNSPEDHVVPPSNSDHLATSVSGPVERVTLERSYHVATLDYDKHIVEDRIVDFANKVVT
jgi:carboxylesterase